MLALMASLLVQVPKASLPGTFLGLNCAIISFGIYWTPTSEQEVKLGSHRLQCSWNISVLVNHQGGLVKTQLLIQ